MFFRRVGVDSPTFVFFAARAKRGENMLLVLQFRMRWYDMMASVYSTSGNLFSLVYTSMDIVVQKYILVLGVNRCVLVALWVLSSTPPPPLAL